MLSEGQEPEAPAYYVLGRNVRDVDAIQAALRLTPVDTAIVYDALDFDFAASVFATIVRADTKHEQAAILEFCRKLARPIAILGDAEFLDAVYADGRRESLAASA